MIVQRKTGRPVQFEITETARESLGAWLERRCRRDNDWLFPSRSHPGEHISTRQYGRLVDEWVTLIGLDAAAYGTHGGGHMNAEIRIDADQIGVEGGVVDFRRGC